MSVLFLFIPSVFNFVSDSFTESYYKTIPQNKVLDNVVIVADDMCLGDTEQIWVGTRSVYIKNGIPANITRELYRIVSVPSHGELSAKVYEDTQDIIIDSVEESTRIQRYEKPLDIGTYFWQLKYNTVSLPAGVIRYDFDVIRTNNFQVRDCATQ